MNLIKKEYKNSRIQTRLAIEWLLVSVKIYPGSFSNIEHNFWLTDDLSFNFPTCLNHFIYGIFLTCALGLLGHFYLVSVDFISNCSVNLFYLEFLQSIEEEP